MAVDNRHDDRVIFTALAFMDSNRIGQRNFIDFLSFVFDILFWIPHIDDIVLNSKYFTYISIKHAFVVIVLFLHDFIAAPKQRLAVFIFAFIFLRLIRLFLNYGIEMFYTTGIFIHRCQHLDSKFVSGFCCFCFIQLANFGSTFFFVLDFYKPKFRIRIDDRQAAVINQMGIRYNTSAFLLTKNRIQAHDRHDLRLNDIMQHRTGPYRRQLICVAN